MRLLLSLVATFLASAVLARPNPAPATPSGTPGRKFALVKVRVEGETETLFERTVLTSGHAVSTDSGGTHKCDGTNNNENPTSGPTATSALDDTHLPFDGTFSTTFDDFFITSIDSLTETDTKFWGLLLDFQFTAVGGCQQRVQEGQEVLWAFDAFNKAHFLKLTGPKVVRPGARFAVTVTDGSTGQPVQAAAIGDAVSDKDGRAIIRADGAGVLKLKAEREDSIRSNELTVLVA